SGSEQALNRKSVKHQGRPICQYNINGILIQKWDKINDAAKALNVIASNIILACNNGNIYHNCFWRYHVEFYPNEEWRLSPFVQYKPFYVSSYGRILRPNGRISNGNVHNGYMTITIYDINTNEMYERRVH